MCTSIINCEEVSDDEMFEIYTGSKIVLKKSFGSNFLLRNFYDFLHEAFCHLIFLIKREFILSEKNLTSHETSRV